MSHQTKQETDKLKECILRDIKKRKKLKKETKQSAKQENQKVAKTEKRRLTINMKK